MDFLRQCHSQEVDCQQILGCLFGAFHARRLCTAVLQRKHITAKIEKDEIGVLPVPSIHQVKAPEEETSRDLRMKRRSVSFFFSPLDCLYTHAFLTFLAIESLVSFRPLLMPQIIVGFVLVMLFFSYLLQIISLPKIHPDSFSSPPLQVQCNSL